MKIQTSTQACAFDSSDASAAPDLTVGIDVNFGGPIWPEPQLIELPRIVPLDQPPVTLLGYPLTMVLAEKLVTALDRGEGNTRWRDFADVYTLMRLHSVEADTFRSSLETVSTYRGVALAPVLPEAFVEVLNDIARFSDPVLQGTAGGSWSIAERSWG